MDLEFMVLDTFDSLRPALIKFQSLDEAEQAVALIEEREAKGKDIVDLLASYHKDGGGYDFTGAQQQYYYEDDYYYGAE